MSSNELKRRVELKAVWINEILNELGVDIGFHKYCAGYKQ